MATIDSSTALSKENVYLYYPNLIGFVRVALSVAALLVSLDRPVLAIILYLSGFALDGVDGHVARMFDQCTQLGMLLDMLTDRCCLAGLLLVLSHLYPDYSMIFIELLILDGASHWILMCSALYSGKTSHKSVDEKQNPLVRLYYTNRKFMAAVCIFSESCFMFMYLCAHYPENDILKGLVLLCAPGCIFKQYVSVLQMFMGFDDLVKLH
eukprot:TRINITY_DN2058_c0_g1::TRINITY_DN2058_c0_g1_i1::g.21786::m.21786 TRINITY_DN2058_c0_g1::TRINITY_DN2058_c0_g1_i1::g.21786  ORF type:complete len:231 (+),score=24.11,sp/Q10153/PIS_SCHPO/37.79/5e-37,CDP-OH_P_transf/PF01066.16/8.8e-15 TRINITY_DN2058_c0_g1_i1:66-695(+)